jgi:hypothetical protein
MACKKIPQAEIDAAILSLNQAKEAQADVYLVAEYLALQDSLNKINVEIESQNSKMLGSFKQPKQKLTMVSDQAAGLVTKTETRKQEIRTDVAAAQLAITEVMNENSKLIELAPKGKEGKQAIESIMSDLNMINISVTEIPVLVEQGELLTAQTKVNAARQMATQINTELKTVLEKYAKKN